jgi:outer membrane protein OmpA-like peptidoglycan-associated protein
MTARARSPQRAASARRRAAWLGAWVAGLLLAACARPPANLIVLAPNPDGTTGAIVVQNAAGSQTIRQAGQGTTIASAAAAPAAPAPVSDQDIARTFSAALAAQPEPPSRFLLYFQLGSAQLTQDSERLVPEIIKTVAGRRSREVLIVGHTDRLGSQADNYRLGLERATHVKNLLVTRGLDAALIEIDSHGEDNPLVPAADQVAEPRNRRVEVTVR